MPTRPSPARRGTWWARGTRYRDSHGDYSDGLLAEAAGLCCVILFGTKDEFEAKRAQFAGVKAFVAKLTHADGSAYGGINNYADPQGFSTLLRQHLEAFVNERLGATSSAVANDDRQVAHIMNLIEQERAVKAAPRTITEKQSREFRKQTGRRPKGDILVMQTNVEDETVHFRRCSAPC